MKAGAYRRGPAYALVLMRKHSMAAIAAVLVLAGCGGAPEAPEPEGAAAPTASAEVPAQPETATPAPDLPEDAEPADISYEGSVTTEEGGFVEYPDGLVVRVVEAEQLPRDDYAVEQFDHDARIRVVIELSNVGAEPVPLEPSVAQILLHGENRYEGQWWASDDDSSTLPRRLMPGTSATFESVQTLPADGLDELALLVNPRDGYYTDYTFADLETLL